MTVARAPTARVAWLREVPFGLLAAVRLDAPDPVSFVAGPVTGLQPLPQGDLDLAGGYGGRRALDFIAGRLALREALRHLDLPAPPAIPHAPGGAPSLRGLAASLSHKGDDAGTLAVALLARRAGPGGGETGGRAGGAVGVDVEWSAGPWPDAATALVLRPEELADLSRLPPARRPFESLLRFSLKEALYKAASPVVPGPLGFHDAAVRPLPDGTAELRLHGPLAQLAGAPFELRWRQEGPALVCAARRSAAPHPGGT